MTATDELRQRLLERGVKWERTSIGRGTVWDGEYGTVWTADSGEVLSMLCDTTPEQAIEATLGRGTCHNLAGQGEDGDWGFCCSECGARPKYWCGEVHIPSSGELPDGTRWLGDSWLPWRYCPNCGRRVVAGDGE